MNPFHDQLHRCMRHPHQRLVGVCASCLRERLAVLEDPRRGDEAPKSSSLESTCSAPSQRRSPRPAYIDKGVASLVIHDKEEGQSLLPPKLKLERVSVPPSPDPNQIGVPTLSPCSNERNKSLPSRRSNASECDRPSKMEARKKKPSWRSFFHLNEENRDPRSKERLSISSPIEVVEPRNSNAARAPHEKSRLDQVSAVMRSPRLSAVRKSREAVGSSTPETFTADPEAVADISLGEPAVRLDVERNDNASWISTLFQRRKPRSKSMSVGKSSTAAVGTNGFMESSRSSLDAGRLSLDGARVNIRQILKKHEARKQGHWDRSPVMVPLDHAKRCSDMDREGRGAQHLADLIALQKRKPPLNPYASARSSISVEIPKDFHAAATHAPTGLPRSESRAEERYRGSCAKAPNHANSSSLATDEVDDDRYFSRSRSWGRAWSRTLSPLWGFKQQQPNRREAAIDEGLISGPHPASSTPDRNHRAHRTSNLSKEPGAALSFYYSPLRKSKHAGGVRFAT